MKNSVVNSRTRVFAFLLLQSILLTTFAQQNDEWAEADEIVRAIQLPSIPARDYLITDFGAQNEGTRDARPAIQAAIKKAHAEGGGRVVIPAGNWYSRGQIHLASRIDLHIS